MDFSELLGKAAAVAPGVKAISLLGLDGLAVETLVLDGALGNLPGWELELADLLRSVGQATTALGWTASGELALEAGNNTLLARPVGPAYYLLMLVDSNANVARASYELRRAVDALAGPS